MRAGPGSTQCRRGTASDAGNRVVGPTSAAQTQGSFGTDENALIRLWKEKRGEIEPEDLSGKLLVQFGCATEDLNRRWFERETGRTLRQIQRFVRHPRIDWMGATLDGLVEEETAVFEAKFMLPWAFTEESAAEKHMPQLQHNMVVTGTRKAYLSILDRRRQVGVDRGGGRSGLPDRARAGGADLLALRADRRGAPGLRGRAAESEAADRADRRYGRLECLGRVCGHLRPHPGSPWRTLWSRTRTSRAREICTQVAVEVEPHVFLTD